MTIWVDTHCHLQLSEDSASDMLDRAQAVGVHWVVAPGTDASTSEASRRLADEFPDRVLATAGLHPHHAERWSEEREAITRLGSVASAIGECGLDFYRNLAPRDDQVGAFVAQVALARELDKPVIVHCRDAFAEVHDLLEASGWAHRAVLHCWTGGPKWTRRFRDLGVTFSFAGPITFETGDTVRLGAALAPHERTMIETDTPYLTPPPGRGLANEPANVVAVGEALAAVWDVPVGEVAQLTTATASRVFGRG